MGLLLYARVCSISDIIMPILLDTYVPQSRDCHELARRELRELFNKCLLVQYARENRALGISHHA